MRWSIGRSPENASLAVVIVSRSGERIYQQVAGWADCETRRPMARDTIFRYASLAKPLVTVAALRLVEQQRLTLDGEVTEFWKGMRFWPITQISRGAWHTCFMRFHGG